MKAWSVRVARLYLYLCHARMRRAAAFPIAGPATLAAPRAKEFIPSKFFCNAGVLAAATLACILPPAE